MSKRKVIMLSADIMSVIFILTFPISIYFVPIEISHNIKGIPLSLIICCADVLPAVVGFGWLNWRYQRPSIIISQFQAEHRLLTFMLIILLSIIMAFILNSYMGRR